VGLLGAYLGRGLMLTIASLVATSVWLKVIGAVYLVKLAFDNLGASAPAEGEEVVRPFDNSTFWRVVLSVEIADLVFSLDNVVSAVSLSDKLWVVMLGVAIGILLMRFAAGWFSYAVERAPVLKVAAYLLVFNIGVEIFLEEFAGIEISDLLRFAISVSTVFITLIYSYTRPLHILRPILSWVARGFSRFNAVLDWALEPLFAVLRVFWKAFIWIISLLRPVKESV
jgi:tellurite resistance protein TerC